MASEVKWPARFKKYFLLQNMVTNLDKGDLQHLIQKCIQVPTYLVLRYLVIICHLPHDFQIISTNLALTTFK